MKSIFVILFVLPVLLLSASGTDTTAEEIDKIVIGAVEDIILLPWGIKMPARIDTGAATTSLDVREITIKNNIVEFKLADKYGGLQLKLPIVNWLVIRSAEAKERRPVVEMEFCLATTKVRALVNLNDRSNVKYPVLIGRNVLKKGFIVDCMKKSSPPVCSDSSAK